MESAPTKFITLEMEVHKMSGGSEMAKWQKRWFCLTDYGAFTTDAKKGSSNPKVHVTFNERSKVIIANKGSERNKNAVRTSHDTWSIEKDFVFAIEHYLHEGDTHGRTFYYHTDDENKLAKITAAIQNNIKAALAASKKEADYMAKHLNADVSKRSNFSGEWLANSKESSDIGSLMKLLGAKAMERKVAKKSGTETENIDHKGDNFEHWLVLKTKIKTKSAHAKMVLDGKTTFTSEILNGDPAMGTARWLTDNIIETTLIDQSELGGVNKIRYELSTDGKKLTAMIEHANWYGEATAERVFDHQGPPHVPK